MHGLQHGEAIITAVNFAVYFGRNFAVDYGANGFGPRLRPGVNTRMRARATELSV